MTSLPAGILGINFNIDGYVISSLVSQLFIDQTWTADEFNDIITSDPSYVDAVHLNNLRVLVLLEDMREQTNYQYLDAVMYYSSGLLYMECSKVGPPGQTFDLQRINIYDLLRSVGSPYVATLPDFGGCNCQCDCACKALQYGKKGILAIEDTKNLSGIYTPNIDNENCNEAFRNRK